jgi:nucleotide-binding universal stress UspA family protein
MRTLASRVASVPAGRQADGAELIVLSWSGSLERGRASVVRELLETAPCPLLIVPSDAAAG